MLREFITMQSFAQSVSIPPVVFADRELGETKNSRMNYFLFFYFKLSEM